jgi:SulP family sulfate permease
MPEHPTAEVWGALAAMLVALPSAIAFGVTVLAPLGPDYAAQGAVAGIIGATVLGLVAPLFGGTPRLITAPCAPAAAVLSAFAIQLAAGDVDGPTAVALIAVVVLCCGVLQVGFGVARLGRLIKYMPYPVVSGYLSGVGLVLIVSQIPELLGVPDDVGLLASLTQVHTWDWRAIVVGTATIAVTVVAGRLTQRVPAAILGLATGLAGYFLLALADGALLQPADNPLIVGPLNIADGDLLGAAADRFNGLFALDIALLGLVVTPALTLAVLLSIDTLKTCVVLDALSRSRHDSNRELIGQGLANLASTFGGGVPGAGQMGATLVNMTSGGKTRLSGFLEGVFCLVVFLALGSLVTWVPISALAGILIVVGVRMIDWRSLQMLRSRETVLDFVVILSVIVVAKSVSLIAASAVGVALAILLYIREQSATSVVARQSRGDRMFSKQMRLPAEREILAAKGDRTAIFELQGSLFFGTSDQIYRMLEPELGRVDYLVLDLRRVQSVDVTAAHVLEQIEAILAERGAVLVYSALPRRLPSGRDMARYFSELGLVRREGAARYFDELDEALEWIEARILAAARSVRERETPLELTEMDLLGGRKQSTVQALQACFEARHVTAGERIFARGDGGDELYLIRRGGVRILLSVGPNQDHHLASFGRGDFFGEMSFLDQQPRSADAYADTDTDLYVLSRQRFDAFASDHKRAGMDLLQGLARSLAVRLRYTNAELRSLQGS